MTGIQVENLTRERILVTAGRVADTMWARMRGLIAHQSLRPGEGLLIVRCRSVHTHFMGFPIDVLYVSAAKEVVGMDRNLVPWRFGRFYRGVRFVIELPAGTADATGTEIGDRLEVRGYEV